MKIVQNNGNILTSGVFYEYNYTDNEAFVVSNKDNKYGVCNNKGEMVYPCISDEITYSHTTKLFIIKKVIHMDVLTNMVKLLYHLYIHLCMILIRV